MGNVALQDPVIEAFRAGLKDQGYIEGKKFASSFVAHKAIWTCYPR
jgi:hypothetical protein